MCHSSIDPALTFNINDLVSKMKGDRFCAAIAMDDKTLAMEPCSHSLWVRCAPFGLERAIWNILFNARDATSDKGRITLATTRVSITDEHLADHPEARVGTYACITVSDNGCGVSAEDLPHIFGPFFSSKGQTGLGLWSSRETVRKDGGWIEVRTGVGYGTIFSIFLPEVDPPK